jgi:hypothetical protein
MHLLTNRPPGLTVIAEFFGGPFNRQQALAETDDTAASGLRLEPGTFDPDLVRKLYRLDRIVDVSGTLYGAYIVKAPKRPFQKKHDRESITPDYDPDEDDDDWWRSAA